MACWKTFFFLAITNFVMKISVLINNFLAIEQNLKENFLFILHLQKIYSNTKQYT